MQKGGGGLNGRHMKTIAAIQQRADVTTASHGPSRLR